MSTKEIYEFEIHRNAEGIALAYASVKGDGSGYRIAGPKAWGGSKCLARIEISQRDLVEFVRCYAKGALAELVAQQTDSERDAALKFANHIINGIFEGGDWDGGDVQELAVKYGMLKTETMQGPCKEEGCACAENGAEFPSICYRKTYAAAMAAHQGEKGGAA